jgi:hypothetical protein
MRKLLPIAIAAALAVMPTLAVAQDDATVTPLPAGTAAGVERAPLVTSSALWWVGGAVIVAAAIAIPLSHHSSSSTTTTAGHH